MVVIWMSNPSVLHKLTDLCQGQDTYSEGGTHEETLRPQSKAEI